jgi:hypothetical protein
VINVRPVTRPVWVAGVIALATAASVEAQSLNSRLSRLEYTTVYGVAEDTFTSSGLQSSADVDLAGSLLLSFADSKAGLVLDDPGRPWSASVGVLNGHEFAITGSVSEFSRISASGSTEVSAAATGEGSALMTVPAAGNRLEFGFTLASTVSANLSGVVTLAPGFGFLGGSVILQRFDGFIFATIFNTLSLPGEQGAFDVDLELTAGEYRLIGDSNASAFAFAGGAASATAENSWSYDLTIVPAPASALVLAAGGLLRRRRR